MPSESFSAVVTLRIKGIDFDVKFSPDAESAKVAADDFCRSNLVILGIPESKHSECISSVSKYLVAAIDDIKKPSDDASNLVIASVPLGGANYQLRFSRNVQSISSVSKSFCNERTTSGVITADNLASCIEFVSRYLHNTAIETSSTSATGAPPPKSTEAASDLRPSNSTRLLKIHIVGKDYRISYNPETGPILAARSFCVQEKSSFGLSSANILYDCVNPVAEYISRAPESTTSDRKVKLTVNIAGSDKDIVFSPAVDDANNTAIAFCQREGPALGIPPSFAHLCITPITELLSEAAQRVASAGVETTDSVALSRDLSIRVTLNVAGNNYTIPYSPTLGPNITARAFCYQEGPAIGVTEAFMSQCIDPVASHLWDAGLRLIAISTKQIEGQESKVPLLPAAASGVTFSFKFNNLNLKVKYDGVSPPKSVAEKFCWDEASNLLLDAGAFGRCLAEVEKHVSEVLNALSKSL